MSVAMAVKVSEIASSIHADLPEGHEQFHAPGRAQLCPHADTSLAMLTRRGANQQINKIDSKRIPKQQAVERLDPLPSAGTALHVRAGLAAPR
ncbi:MAG TPA: hypothetical protein VGQ91_14800, partial [Ideonella sp.]|nr:hypothetical protein [Ideonella sp.]